MTTDETLIANVLSDYCWSVDRLDVDALLGLFTPDARFDLGLCRSFTGRDELRRLYERLDAYRATSHHVTSPRIVVEGDKADVRSGIYAHHVRHDGSTMSLWGVYLDGFAKVDGAWLIEERALRASCEQGGRAENGRPTQFELLPRG